MEYIWKLESIGIKPDNKTEEECLGIVIDLLIAALKDLDETERARFRRNLKSVTEKPSN